MGKSVNANASEKDIIDTGVKTLRTTAPMTDEVHDLSENRLGPPLARYAAAAVSDNAARDKEETARATLVLSDKDSKAGIRLLKDTMYNLLGRPRSSAQMDQVFPDGIDEYLTKTPEEQPTMMQVLVARLDGVASRKFTAEARTSCVNQINELRAAEEAALVALKPLVLAARITRSEVKTSVVLVRAGLLGLKRDLLTAGMSEAQIHEIIPDASPSTKKPTGDGNDGGNSGPAGPATNSSGSASA